MGNGGRAGPRCTSTVTSGASIPASARLATVATVIKSSVCPARTTRPGARGLPGSLAYLQFSGGTGDATQYGGKNYRVECRRSWSGHLNSASRYCFLGSLFLPRLTSRSPHAQWIAGCSDRSWHPPVTAHAETVAPQTLSRRHSVAISAW